MELIDGTEVTPKDATLAGLKRDRIAHRLIGNFGFSDVGRSFDGVQYTLNRSRLNITAFGGRPTRAASFRWMDGENLTSMSFMEP